ncbi:MAG TPA: ATP-binding protein [Steroidobacteraceae bacterium]|nr:ATP-binding protein [Steroidobacteraceae bacterium]
MKWPQLGIFGRSFLLTIAALVVAEGVGIALLISRPPMHNAPVRLSEIARQLSGAMPRGGFRPGFGEGGPPPGAPGGNGGPGGPDRPGGPGGAGGPGGTVGPGGAGGPGGDFGPPPFSGGPPNAPPGAFMGGGRRLDLFRREFSVSDAVAPPAAPKDADASASDALRNTLAARLGVTRDRVRVWVGEPPVILGDDPLLREGFTAAWQKDDGSWRVIISEVEGFPNAFQRQAMWLFAIGLGVLLPVSWLFARALAAPIQRFSQAAKRLGTDPHAPSLERAGPTEMLAAIDSFNAMQGRVTRLLQERSHMIGAIAHDLRTPLMRLSFRLDSLDSPLREKVEADINEMKLMISAALDFLRDQAAGGARQRLDLRLLVESVVDDQADVGHDVSLAGGQPILLEGDPLSLRRMVVNLVENAIKYGERARLRLKVDGPTCTLEIDDDGPGIPESLQQRVFEPFFRTEASRNRDTGGIGLGLTTVRSVALDHGGHIELRNRKEGGLRVTVQLPMPEN